jgi:hypothetical protein
MATISALLTAPDARLVMRSLELRIREIHAESRTPTADQRRADAFVEFFTKGEESAERADSSQEMSHSGGFANSGGSSVSSSESVSNSDITPRGGSSAKRKNSAMTINVIVDLPTLMGLAENPAELSGYGPIPATLARELATSHQWRRFITDPVTGELLDLGRERYQPPQALIEFIAARDRLKTHGGWQISSNPDGSCTWTSPYGKSYSVPARPINEVA